MGLERARVKAASLQNRPSPPRAARNQARERVVAKAAAAVKHATGSNRTSWTWALGPEDLIYTTKRPMPSFP